MIVRMIIAVGVLLLMCAIMAVLARRLRGVPPTRLLINLLFPFSQLCIVAFLFYYAIAYELPFWMFALVAVVGALCGPVDLVLFKALEESEKRELSRERVRLLEEQLQAQEQYLRRLSADIDEARRVREDVARELAAVDDLLQRQEAEQASRGLMKAVGIMDSSCKRSCEHQVVDALVSMKAAVCAERGIRLELDLALADDVSLPSVELCAVFSNLLDNAVSACGKVPEGARFIKLKARVDAGYLAVRMENSCAPAEPGEARRAPRRSRGDRLPEHGWGLNILKTLADRHDGTLETVQETGCKVRWDMRFIVSPAKKMNVVDDAFGWRDLPMFADRAARLADAVRALSYDEAKALWQCSDALAELNFERFRTLEVRSGALTPAVLAYEGIQYQNLAPQVMTMEQLDYLQEHLRILSGLYGVVRPLDGVAPYRLEMQAKLAVDGARNLYEFWGDSLSRVLAAETDVIVNLASVEYAKAVVPSADRCGARVLTCLFGTVDARDRLVQRSTAAKAARGTMVRWCTENAIEEPADLQAFDALGYAFDPARSTDDCYVFVQK